MVALGRIAFLCERRGAQPGKCRLGWVLCGKELLPGVFLWRAELEFVDEVVLGYSGDVTLMR